MYTAVMVGLFNANVTKSSYEWQQQFHHRLVPVSGEDKSMNYEIELLDLISLRLVTNQIRVLITLLQMTSNCTCWHWQQKNFMLLVALCMHTRDTLLCLFWSSGKGSNSHTTVSGCFFYFSSLLESVGRVRRLAFQAKDVWKSKREKGRMTFESFTFN